MKLWNQLWFESDHPALRVRALKVLLYGLAAFDMWALMIEHASRYGAGGFNVAQNALFALLPIPQPALIVFLWLIGGFMALRAAFGIQYRMSAGLAAGAYLTVYFWSQADSYQHHYLVGLMMAVGAFLPPNGDPKEGRHWAMPVIYVQLALLYFWTAVAKCDPTWLSGATMNQLTGVPAVRVFLSELAVSWGISTSELFSWIAWGTVFGEFFAAAAFLFPKLRLLGLFIVPWFHIGVEVLGFDIELFSYYMIALDFILLSPVLTWVWLAQKQPALMGPLNRSFNGSTGLQLRLLLAVVCGGLAYLTPGPVSLALALTIAASIALPLLWSRQLKAWTMIANPVVVVCLLSTVMLSESMYDFYRMWGGDLRRRGEVQDAMQKYEAANAIKADEPARRMQLGRLYEKAGRVDEAHQLFEQSYTIYEGVIAERARATFKDPTDHAAFIELAEDTLRYADRCRHMIAVAQARGEDAQSFRSLRKGALQDVAGALKKADEIQPDDRRKTRRLRRQLSGAQRKSP